MCCRAPVFVIGFQRGGTNILTNLLASHPDLRVLDRETHQIFYGKGRERIAKWVRRILYLPVLAGARGHLFRPTNCRERRPVPDLIRRYIDFLLYHQSLRSPQMDSPTHPGTAPRGAAHIRVLAKNVNGLAFVTPLLADMYPDATFFALVRDGLALCEGYVRRGRSSAEFGKIYSRVCTQMLRDAECRANYHLLRFEDLIADPSGVIRSVYDRAGLDATLVRAYRLQAKQSMGTDGKRSYTFGARQDRETRWFSPGELAGCFRLDVNANQIARLAPTDRDRFLVRTEEIMGRLGYR